MVDVVTNPRLEADVDVLRLFFDETGGKDKWKQGVAHFGRRLEKPPPPPDHAPQLDERIEQAKEPLPRHVPYLDHQFFERRVPEHMELEKFREAPVEPLKERGIKWHFMGIDPPNPLPSDSLAWLQNPDVGKWLGVKTNDDPTWHFNVKGEKLRWRHADGDERRIAHVALDWNGLDGTLPRALGALYALHELSLSGNALHGHIPRELGACAALRVLRLAHNALSGEIPTELGGCGKLEELVLGHNRLRGALPAALGRCAALRVLSVRANGAIDGFIPDELATGLVSLRVLDVADNNLYAREAAVLSSRSSGATADVDAERGEPPLPSAHLSCAVLGLLCRLAFFDVRGNEALAPHDRDGDGEDGDNYPAHRTLAARIAWLNSHDGGGGARGGGGGGALRAHAASSGVGEQWPLRDARALVLTRMRLRGMLPRTLGCVGAGRGGGGATLRVLDLSANEISGSLPPSLARMRALRSLRLHRNQLSGTILVETFAELQHLRELWLHANRFFGETETDGECASARAKQAPTPAERSRRADIKRQLLSALPSGCNVQL